MYYQEKMSTRNMRKRRANSDSELTLLDSLARQVERKSLSFDYDIPMMTNDDINIDILSDSAVDNNLFNGDSTMDPSQMFVLSSNLQNLFSSTPPPIPLMESTSNINMPTEEPIDDPIDDTPVLVPSAEDPPNNIYPTQFFFLNTTGIDTATLFVSDNQGESFTEEQVTGIYAVEVPKETIPGNHVPAKHVKKNVKKEPRLLAPKPTVEIKNDDESKINKQWINDKMELKERGCKWKSGLWSNDEEQLLRANIDNYCKKMNMPDPIKMIYFTPKEERKEFYRSIAIGINRPLFAIYRKVLRIYDNKNYVGKYSPEEVEKLEKLNQICPNDWKSIGLLLGRSASSVKDRARLIKPEIIRGRWKDSELKLLSKAIREVTKTKEGESVTDRINWVEVAQKIGTRTSKQCRMKWLTYLNWKEAGGKEWVKSDEIELIQRVAKIDVEEESLIDWNIVANGWASVRSPQWLHQKWWQIKSTLPNYQSCSFTELLQHLQDTYIPQLMERIHQDLDANILDSKITPFEQKDLPDLPGDIVSLDMPESYFGRSLWKYEFQLLNSGDQSQRILNLLPSNMDLVNEPLTNNCMSTKTGVDFVNSLKSEPIFSTFDPNELQLTDEKSRVDFTNDLKHESSLSRSISFDNVMKSLSDDSELNNDPSFSDTLSTVSASVSMVDDICSHTTNSSESTALFPT